MTSPFQDGWTVDDMEAAIDRNNPDELLYVPIWTSMDPPNCEWVEEVCVRLSRHDNFNVRGNAVLGFGHLARTCGCLNQELVQPIIERALSDKSEYVRGQASSALADIEHFLNWGVFKHA